MKKVFKDKSVRTMLGNSNPDKIKVCGIQDEFTVAPGHSSLGGIVVGQNPTPKIPDEIDLKKFYQGKKG